MQEAIDRYLNREGAIIDEKAYQKMYQESINNPEAFWGRLAEQHLHWEQKWDKVLSGDFNNLPVNWFTGAKLNASYNCLDRHLPDFKNKIAIIWEGDEPKQTRKLTYGELHENVCRFANVLITQGIEKGDRVCIYMPMIPEAIIAMLACARIGAIHSVVFAGFSANSLKQRILDSECKLLISVDEAKRGGKTIPLMDNAKSILPDCPSIQSTIFVRHCSKKNNLTASMHWYHDLMADAKTTCEAIALDATDPLFILYTSGSTGKPKGVQHSIGGYLLHAVSSFKYIFNYQHDDVFWCTADIGWITGHSYIVYGPLANAATILIYEGTPTYPTPARYWQIIDKHAVNIFYTAPTAIRALRREGDEYLISTHRGSLKLLGSVGEPINPDVWLWYYNKVGKSKCPIVDTWWQTETGGIMISAMPYATALKPGAASLPFFGVELALFDDEGKLVKDEGHGNLVVSKPWPGMLQTIYKDEQRFRKTYFSQQKGFYFTGDGACRDADGYYWVMGRVDDVINVSGHRIDTAEVENVLVSHATVAEAAVVGIKHTIKGQAVLAYIIVSEQPKDEYHFKEELVELVKSTIGSFAKPEQIKIVPDLPKTRSGKIMRRILRKIAEDKLDELGDTSTLANPEAVEQLIEAANLTQT